MNATDTANVFRCSYGHVTIPIVINGTGRRPVLRCRVCAKISNYRYKFGQRGEALALTDYLCATCRDTGLVHYRPCPDCNGEES